MNSIRLLLVLLGIGFVVAVGRSAAAEAVRRTTPAEILVTANESRLGVAYPYQEVFADVMLTNQSNKPLKIRVEPRYPGDRVVLESPLTLGPQLAVSIKIAIKTEHVTGNLVRYFDVFDADEKKSSDVIGSFAVRGFVDWVIDPESAAVEFGNASVASGVSREVVLRTRPGVALSLEEPEGRNPRFDLKIVGSNTFRLTVRKDAPLGLFNDYLVVRTSDANQKFVGVRVRGQLFDGVLPSANPVDFGLLRVGDSSEQIVKLDDVSGSPIGIGSISVEGLQVGTKLEECLPRSPSCRQLRLKIPKQDSRGQVNGRVLVELLPSKKVMPVDFGAVVIGKDTKIRNLAEDMRAAANAEAPISSMLQNAIQVPVSPLEMVPPLGSGPLLTWQAAHEGGVYGYEVYRADAQDGPFKRVSSGIIPRLDQSGNQGSVYRWRDADYQSGETYWYYVNVVMESGSKREFTTPQKVVAK